MSPTVSGVILMLAGFFFAGGAISFARQRLSRIVIGVLWILAAALVVYGFYVMTLD